MSSIELLSECTSSELKSKDSNISLENISLDYGQSGKKFRALENINLQLCSDDFVCVLGPSGCGKSSLLNIIAGYLTPSSGNVFIDGNSHTSPDPQVGVVFQQPNLLPWLNIQKNVEFGLKMQGASKAKRVEIASHYLELVGLRDYDKSYPHQLSGGMKQRAAIARTLAADPKIILLDEPFSALDALTREKMQKHLYFIWEKTRKCLFFITHDVDEALLLGNRIIIMHSNPGRIIKEYKNPLIRSKEQNFRKLRSQKEFFEMREYLIDQIQEDDEKNNE